MVLSPLQWLVRVLARLPDALRPGLFIAILLLVVWFAIVQRGIPLLWRATCRALARLLYFTIDLVLFAEYLLTTARRHRGGRPGQATLLFGDIAERLQDGALGVYEHYQPAKAVWKTVPWIPCSLIVAACAGAWVIMDQTAPGQETRHRLAEVFEYWRDVERWAHVDASRRAGPGEPLDRTLRVGRIRRRGRELYVPLHCHSSERCHGKLVVWGTSGTLLAAKSVGVAAGTTATAKLRLRGGSDSSLRQLQVVVVKT